MDICGGGPSYLTSVIIKKEVFETMDYRISLRPTEVKEFVEAATRSDCYIDVSTSKNCMVDAKSILGVLGLDLTRMVTVTVHGYDREFEKYIRRFSMAC